MDSHAINSGIITERISHENPYDFSQIHRHRYFEIMLFERESGEGINSIDFVEYPIRRHALHIVAPNQAHLMQRKATDNGIVLQFTKAYLLSSLPTFQIDWLFSLQSSPSTALEAEQFERLFPSFSDLHEMSRARSKFSDQIIRHYFYFVIFQVLEILNSRITQPVNSSAIEFLGLAERQFKENRTMANYAAQMNISVRKLNSDIKSSFGKTPLQLVHDMLAVEIKRLVLVENLSQKEIAYELNFDSPASYTRFVKKYFNCKPTELKAHS